VGFTWGAFTGNEFSTRLKSDGAGESRRRRAGNICGQLGEAVTTSTTPEPHGTNRWRFDVFETDAPSFATLAVYSDEV